MLEHLEPQNCYSQKGNMLSKFVSVLELYKNLILENAYS